MNGYITKGLIRFICMNFIILAFGFSQMIIEQDNESNTVVIDASDGYLGERYWVYKENRKIGLIEIISVNKNLEETTAKILRSKSDQLIGRTIQIIQNRTGLTWSPSITFFPVNILINDLFFKNSSKASKDLPNYGYIISFSIPPKKIGPISLFDLKLNPTLSIYNAQLLSGILFELGSIHEFELIPEILTISPKANVGIGVNLYLLQSSNRFHSGGDWTVKAGNGADIVEGKVAPSNFVFTNNIGVQLEYLYRWNRSIYLAAGIFNMTRPKKWVYELWIGDELVNKTIIEKKYIEYNLKDIGGISWTFGWNWWY